MLMKSFKTNNYQNKNFMQHYEKSFKTVINIFIQTYILCAIFIVKLIQFENKNMY